MPRMGAPESSRLAARSGEHLPTWEQTLLQRSAAEAVGTFILVGAGTGAVAVGSLGAEIGGAGVAAAFGLGVMIAIFALGHISGAHLNPAVTCGFLVIGRISGVDAAGYAAGQLAGALAASLGLRAALGGDVPLGVTEPVLVGSAGAFAIEIVVTAILMLVIVSVATDTRAQGALAAIAIGGTVAVAALVMGPAQGASMNPARSAAPALVAADVGALWIYLIAPVIGAVLGALLYHALRAGARPSS